MFNQKFQMISICKTTDFFFSNKVWCRLVSCKEWLGFHWQAPVCRSGWSRQVTAAVILSLQPYPFTLEARWMGKSHTAPTRTHPTRVSMVGHILQGMFRGEHAWLKDVLWLKSSLWHRLNEWWYCTVYLCYLLSAVLLSCLFKMALTI